MSSPPKYSVNESVLVAQLAEEAVLLHLGSKRYFRLNRTGAAIWQGLTAGLDVDAIVESLTRQFAVDGATARAEVERLLHQLQENRLIT